MKAIDINIWHCLVIMYKKYGTKKCIAQYKWSLPDVKRQVSRASLKKGYNTLYLKFPFNITYIYLFMFHTIANVVVRPDANGNNYGLKGLKNTKEKGFSIKGVSFLRFIWKKKFTLLLLSVLISLPKCVNNPRLW